MIPIHRGLALALLRTRTSALLGLLCGFLGSAEPVAAAASAPNGLILNLSPANESTVGATSSRDTIVSSNISLFVAGDSSPSPFFPPGKFKAVWEGSLLSDLRAEYRFEAELQGQVKVAINGAVVYESATGRSNRSQVVRLNKGNNALSVDFESPAAGDAFLRLFWVPPENQPEPIPVSALALPSNNVPNLALADQRRIGRDLFFQYRCARCHTLDSEPANVPDLALDAPAFENIGARLNAGWMAAWILDPKAARPSAHMPRMLHGPAAAGEAAEIASYLASLNGKSSLTPSGTSKPSIEDGKTLFDNLHCAACHDPGAGTNRHSISLKQTGRKFLPGALEEYLLQPDLHYAWNPMPGFKLSAEEASKLAVYLMSLSGDSPPANPSSVSGTGDRGGKLLQTRGCLNCHRLQLSNEFKAPPLAKLTAGNWARGCLAEAGAPSSSAPIFGWTEPERRALQAFARSDLKSLQRHVPGDYARRQIEALNCAGCHGKVEGFPGLALLGGKLNPAWAAAFISGKVSAKPRPWIEARMPTFSKYGEWIAPGLAMEHGYPKERPAEPPFQADLSAIGQKLVSAEGGFSCISCHAVGSVAATAVFESAGINLAWSGERLLKPYFERWLHNPPRIDPETKMPVYFIEGKSSLTDVFDGDAGQQIRAIWEYLRLGEKMPPPPGVTAP